MRMGKYSHKLLKSLPVITLLSCSIVSSLPTVVQAGVGVTFDPPTTNKPVQSSGGASRGDHCAVDAQNTEIPLTPLLPATQQGLTVASHPTFLVYIPPTTAKNAFFALRDKAEEYDYQTILPISERSGVISLQLPQSAPDLEVGKNYQWSLVLMCDEKLRPDSPVAQGYITRIKPEFQLSKKLQAANELESAALYGEAGIWYETVATLAKLKSAQPQDSKVSATWEQFLTSVGLEDVAKAQLVE